MVAASFAASTLSFDAGEEAMLTTPIPMRKRRLSIEVTFNNERGAGADVTPERPTKRVRADAGDRTTTPVAEWTAVAGANISPGLTHEPSRVQTRARPFTILGLGLDASVSEIVCEYVRELGGDVETKLCSRVTHVVCPTARPGIIETSSSLFYEAILWGVWIVSLDWLFESHGKARWLSEASYEITGDAHHATGDGPRRARIHGPRLFDNAQFLVHNLGTRPPSGEPGSDLTLARLRDMIKLGGGRILAKLKMGGSRDGESGDDSGTQIKPHLYVIGDESLNANMRKKLARRYEVSIESVAWLLEHIITGRALPEAEAGASLAAPAK